MTCCRQWWPTIAKDIKFERVRPFQGRIENLRHVYQFRACMALWDKIGQIWSKVAYSSPVFVIVSKYDRLGPYLCLNYLFRAILTLSVRIHYIAIKVPGKRESGQKWSIMTQYVLLLRDMTNYGHNWHSIANSDHFSKSAPEKVTYVFMTRASGRYRRLWQLVVPYDLL